MKSPDRVISPGPDCPSRRARREVVARPGGNLPYRLLHGAWKLALENAGISLTLAVSGAMILALVITVVLPGYTSPLGRLYTSKFGYGSLLRKLKKPFPVTSTHPARRMINRSCLGEGLVRSEPYVVSIVPMGTIVKVYVKEGDPVTKGQLIAEVDATKAQIKAEAARAALITAQAELERVRIGSAYVLQNERPGLDRIRAQQSERELALQKQLQEMHIRLTERGYGTRQELLQQQLLVNQAEAILREKKFNLSMSERGVTQSVIIAETAVRDAELALKHRLYELAEYKIYAIADGRIERCLVHEGEYNQDPGKPGFLISAGAWFEANLDQGAYRRVIVGDDAEVRLEGYPEQVFQGKVFWVKPFVSYDLGGPEAMRPIRPLGTGAPEWPATFVVRIAITPVEGKPILPGMTGFAVIRAGSEGLSLPREAVSAITAGKGIVFQVEGNRFRPREVTLGVTDGDHVEIHDGLGSDDEVIWEGHQVLEPGDRIRVVNHR